jgi:hypothetical protein
MHNEELYKLCSSLNIIRVIKSRRLSEMRNTYIHDFSWEN